ncbi:unnamed protein product [Victoria cruziana]
MVSGELRRGEISTRYCWPSNAL